MDLSSASETATTRGTYFALFLLFGLGALALTIWQGLTSSNRSKRERQGLADFNHNLSDTLRAVEKLIDSEKGANDRADFFNSVISQAKALMPLASPRICVYDLEGADKGQSSAVYLRLAEYGGRADPPRSEFTNDEDWGRAAIAAAQGSTIWCVDDPAREGRRVQRNDEAMWKSFLAVPLRFDGTSRGLVTIDTARKTTFTNDHKAVASTIAMFLTFGMRNVAEAAADVRPEMRSLERDARLAALVRRLSEGRASMPQREGETDGNDR
ncbi:GAF domain-containing protein [Ruania suaedae]|uniref:GAF domain-containing protein n=1 Tax=Ruania suaedae TaxID=2897774 RepID=UPI001E47D380|nr:GAF domain-containing protein [Ruania suaedae]UFU03420.1 GAF domain-containing protein [Ruania suaedae]